MKNIFSRVRAGGFPKPMPFKHSLLKDEDLEPKPVDGGGGRDHWESRTEFLLSLVGFSAGLGNVWRFPYLAYTYGGGSFIIPYIILLILIGKPIHYMQSLLGQFSQTGPLTMWCEMLPAGLGVGVAMLIITTIVSTYYNVVLAYCLYYMFNTFRRVLPWTECNPDWGADSRCFVRNENSTHHFKSTCLFEGFGGGCSKLRSLQTSQQQFWQKAVLDIKEDGLQTFGDLGEIKLNLAFCLLLSWLLVTVCMRKGRKSIGQALCFTATCPYLALTLLLIRGVTLPGAAEGLSHLFIPDVDKLLDLNIWRAAASQVFFSLGLSSSGVLLITSHNRFNGRVHLASHFVTTIDFVTSLMAVVLIFSTVGHASYILGIPVQEIAEGGNQLIFVAYPEALSMVPGANCWTFIFFLTLFCLGLDSQFCQVEVITSAVGEVFPRLQTKGGWLTFIVCSCLFLLGLPCITQRGQHVLDLLDVYGGSLPVLLVAFVELVFIFWVYGAARFRLDVRAMLGFSPGIIPMLCLRFLTPCLLLGIFIWSIVVFEPPTYAGMAYPDWAHYLGYTLTLVSLVQIPFWFLVQIFKQVVRGKPILRAFQPSKAWMLRRNGPEFRSGQVGISKLTATPQPSGRDKPAPTDGNTGGKPARKPTDPVFCVYKQTPNGSVGRDNSWYLENDLYNPPM